MSEIVLEIDIDAASTRSWFEYAGYHIRDARDPLRECFEEVIIPGVEAEFDTQGASSGGWEDLTDEYRERKIADGYGGEADLYRTGEGYLKIIGTPPRITKEYLYWRPDSDYMHWHQSGGYVPGRPPQRPWLVITPEDEQQIEGIFERWLDELRTANARRGAPDAGFTPSFPDFDVLGF